ncbi:MAG TPA: hypothetical protein VJU01_06655 [Gaiellaceae bacterium]|nr:hypothetical protein [Gaiellaceae bacterium]
MKKIVALAGLGALVATLFSAAAMAGGPPQPSFYVNGTLYRTVGTPTDFSKTGAPASSYDTIYQFFGAQTYNVATAAPGDPGYNGGRWRVVGLSFEDYDAALAAHDTNGSDDFDTTAEVQAALDDGSATSLGIVKSFECPVIPLH